MTPEENATGSAGGPSPQHPAGPPAILSIGSVNVDFTARVDRRPDVSETLLASDFRRDGGGKAANVALLARRFGAPAQLLARVGDDDLAQHALAPLHEAGVDTARCERRAGRLTGAAMITVPPDGQKGIVLAANANRDWESGADAAVRAAVDALAPGSVVVIDYEIPPDLVRVAAQRAHERGLTLLLDPSPADAVERAVLALTDVAVPNAVEARTLSGTEVDSPRSALAAARSLREAGVGLAVVKLPDGGCVALGDDGGWHVPSVKVEVVDSNGGGDAFAGAFAAALLGGGDARAASALAVATASIAVTRRGAQAALPEREEAERLAADLIPQTVPS